MAVKLFQKLSRCRGVPFGAGAVAFALAAFGATCRAAGPIGVNCEEPMFVNVIKNSGGFGPAVANEKNFSLDKNGYPTADAAIGLFDVRVNEFWNGPDPKAVAPDMSGIYHLSFTGQAHVAPPAQPPQFKDMFAVEHKHYDKATNTTTAVIVMPKGQGLEVMDFTDTHGGVKNVRLIRPGYKADTKRIFTRSYLKAIKPFNTLRYMDYLSENNFNSPAQAAYPAVTHWADRRRRSYCNETSATAKMHGGSWSYAIDLANQSGKNMWINIPISATDGYVTHLARLLKKKLKPNLNIYVEYSNEVWNNGFVQNWYNATAAKAEGIGNPALRYAKRTVDIGQLFGKVFGASAVGKRIRPVLDWQVYDSPSLEAMLSYIHTTYGPPSKFIYAVGNAPYISPANTSSVAAILAGLKQSAADNRVQCARYAYWAKYNGVKYVAYEGGIGISGPQDLANKLAANRDPRIAAIIREDLLRDWFGAGGNLFCYFNLYGQPGQYGTWGLLENDLHKLNTPKYKGILEAIRAPEPPLNIGRALPTQVGKSVSIDEQNDVENLGYKRGAPAQNMWGSAGSRNDYSIRAVRAGAYSITVQAMASRPGIEKIYVDHKLLGSSTLPATVSATLKPGLHCLWIVAQGPTAMGGGSKIVMKRTK